MKRKLIFGLIGCGEIAVQTAKGIAQSSNSEIGIVQDVNEEIAKDLADKYGVPYCLTWDELLGHRELDAVYIATPHYLHAGAAVAAAAAGKHVLVEKPIATTLADADRMIAAAEKAGVALSVAFALRYTDRSRKVKEIIDGGALGKIVGIDFGEYTYKPESYWTSGWTGRVQTDWRASKEKSGGGILLMNYVHTVDFMRLATGLDVVSVAANYDTFKTKVEVEDYIVVIMRLSNGAIGVARGATIVEGKVFPGGVEGDRIIGTDGQLFITRETIHLYVAKPYREYEAGKWHSIPTAEPWGGRAELIREFSKAVLAGKKPPVAALDGRKALEVCLAAYKSGATGQFVRLPMKE